MHTDTHTYKEKRKKKKEKKKTLSYWYYIILHIKSFKYFFSETIVLSYEIFFGTRTR